MRNLFFIFSFGFIFDCCGQVEFLSSDGNGFLIKSNTVSCCEKKLGKYENFIDICVTPNGKIYGLSGYLFEIDTVNKTYSPICSPTALNGQWAAGAGLVALNDEYLLSDYDDSLSLIQIQTGISYSLGYIGYYCNGDFAFYNNFLYMASDQNELIKIKIDEIDYHVLEVVNLGVMLEIGSVYSLFTTYDNYNSNNKSLFAIEGNNVYRVNTEKASLTLVCQFESEHYSNGGASVYDFNNTDWSQLIPNVFTPNKDGINDFFTMPKSYDIKSFQIFNRWGQEVYVWIDGEKSWDGLINGNLATEGIYYYLAEIERCNSLEKINGYFQLIR
jgi:gliding motility-associated-like protein